MNNAIIPAGTKVKITQGKNAGKTGSVIRFDDGKKGGMSAAYVVDVGGYEGQWILPDELEVANEAKNSAARDAYEKHIDSCARCGGALDFSRMCEEGKKLYETMEAEHMVANAQPVKLTPEQERVWERAFSDGINDGMSDLKADSYAAKVLEERWPDLKGKKFANAQPQPGDKFVDCPICDRQGVTAAHQVKPAAGKDVCEHCGHVYPQAGTVKRNADTIWHKGLGGQPLCGKTTQDGARVAKEAGDVNCQRCLEIEKRYQYEAKNAIGYCQGCGREGEEVVAFQDPKNPTLRGAVRRLCKSCIPSWEREGWSRTLANSDDTKAEFEKESKEHPTLPPEAVKQIVEDHAAKGNDSWEGLRVAMTSTAEAMKGNGFSPDGARRNLKDKFPEADEKDIAMVVRQVYGLKNAWSDMDKYDKKAKELFGVDKFMDLDGRKADIVERAVKSDRAKEKGNAGKETWDQLTIEERKAWLDRTDIPVTAYGLVHLTWSQIPQFEREKLGKFENTSDRAHTPITTEKQAGFFGAELGRLRAGKSTESGMSEAELVRHLKEWGGNSAENKNADFTDALARAAMEIAARGAAEYLRQHKLKADPDALLSTLRSWVKAKLPEALHDAKEALDANMGAAAEQTFKASMVLAGIEAAKEAGFPEGMKNDLYVSAADRQTLGNSRYGSK